MILISLLKSQDHSE